MTVERPFKLIRNGRLLDAQRSEATAADVLIDGPVIVAIGPAGLAAPADAEIIAATDRLLIPGLINTHTHAHGALAKGLVNDRFPPALAPTISLHCSDEFLTGCRDLAAGYDVHMQTHLAETKVPAVLGLQKYGCSLTTYLDRLGMLGPRLSAAHSIWTNIDVAAVRSRVEAAAARLAEASTKGVAFARQLEGYVGAFCSTQMCRPLPVVRHPGSC
jgi:cytosine/adenosine deaminase-related metal-dependent hydrolase